MKILIATGIFPPEIGGPATYAKSLKKEFEELGHEVRIATYGREKRLVTGVRHLIYLLKSLPDIIWSEKILALDTFSVGLPVAVATTIFHRPYILRIGGDFVWEGYVERTHDTLPLPQFYRTGFLDKLTFKERVIFKITKLVLVRASKIVFTTSWLKDIWVPAYSINSAHVIIIENVLEHIGYQEAKEKVFLWAGRLKFLKNTDLLKEALDTVSKEVPEISLELLQVSKEMLEKKLSECYAVILPSLSEVSPNLIYEAIAHGKPFIVTKHSGLSTEIQNLGLVVDPLSIKDIRDRVIEMANQSIYTEIHGRIRDFRGHRTWSKVAEEFLAQLNNS